MEDDSPRRGPPRNFEHDREPGYDRRDLIGRVLVPTEKGTKAAPVRKCTAQQVNPVTGLCKSHDTAPSLGNRYAYGYRDGSECAALAAYPRDAPPIQCGRISTGIVGYEVIERI